MLDSIDLKILGYIQREADIRILDLADKVGLSATPCKRRMKRLEKDGYIVRRVTLLDQNKLGLPVNVFVAVEIAEKTSDNLELFESEIAACEEVMECYLMSGQDDYLLRVVAQDISDYEHFMKNKLTRIPVVRNIRSSFALRQPVYKTSLPLNQRITTR